MYASTQKWEKDYGYAISVGDSLRDINNVQKASNYYHQNINEIITIFYTYYNFSTPSFSSSPETPDGIKY